MEFDKFAESYDTGLMGKGSKRFYIQSAFQMSIDENVVNYLEHFNKITVLKPGISGYADTNPFDFYAISKDTDIN